MSHVALHGGQTGDNLAPGRATWDIFGDVPGCPPLLLTTDPLIFKNKLLEVKEQYYTHEEIYRDGSKDGDKVASAAILDGELYQFRLPNNSCVFFAELKAIDLALNHFEQDAYWRYIIYIDSLSAMQALEGETTDNPLIVSLLEKLSRLCERADIVFCWLPSHVGISGNEEADKAAKDALSVDVLPFKVPFTDFKPLINNFTQNVWQQSGVIQPIKTTNCLLSNQVLANGFRDCGQIAAKKLSWPVFALVIHILRTLISLKEKKSLYVFLAMHLYLLTIYL